MDPNETLKRIRTLIAALEAGARDPDGEACELAEAWRALDGWLSKGGFLPAAWAPGPIACVNGAMSGEPDVEFPIRYRDHVITPNDDACRFEVRTEGDDPKCVDPQAVLFAGPTVEECKKAIDEVVDEIADELEANLGLNDGETETKVLRDYKTGAAMRIATNAEYEASKAASETDGGAGVIVVDGVHCFVDA